MKQKLWHVTVTTARGAHWRRGTFARRPRRWTVMLSPYHQCTTPWFTNPVRNLTVLLHAIVSNRHQCICLCVLSLSLLVHEVYTPLLLSTSPSTTLFPLTSSHHHSIPITTHHYSHSPLTSSPHHLALIPAVNVYAPCQFCKIMFFTLMKTQDWVETSVLFDNDICSTISASGVSLSIIMPVPSHAEFF